jgi:rRNA pseudouridine-1189 N-methylase Emg1 (Nep1/Mra1 family)
MSNYIIIDKESNLIVKIICSSVKPRLIAKYRAIRVSDAILAKYDKRAGLRSRNGTLVDAGELASVSPAFLELLQARG